jgi:hypothetical protein
MRTLPFTHENITGTVRTRYRRTAIIEAQYMSFLREAYPELAAFEQAYVLIEGPKLSGEDKDKEKDEAAIEAYGMRLAPLRATNEVGSEYMIAANLIVKPLARISSISGAPFVLGADGRFAKESVIKAFEMVLDEDLDDDNPTLWDVVKEAIREVDQPLTPKHEAPPETLTGAERRDPLLEPLVSAVTNG